MDMLAGFSQGASRDVGRNIIPSTTSPVGVKVGEAELMKLVC